MQTGLEMGTTEKQQRAFTSSSTDSSAALSWGVKKQATFALSSSKAEYQGMAAGVQEALYLKKLL